MGYRWPTMPGSGRAEVARQIGAVGAQLGSLGAEINAQQAEVEYQDFKLRQAARIDALGDELAENTDEYTYRAATDKVISQMQGDMPRNGLAKRFASSWIKNEIPNLNKALKDSIKRRIKDKSDVVQGRLIESAIRTGNAVDLAEHTIGRVAAGHMSAADAEKVMRETRHQAELWDIRQIALGPNPEIVLENYTNAQELQEDYPTLSADDYQNIRSAAEGNINFKDRRQDAALSSFYDDISKKAEEGMSPKAMREQLLQTPGLTTKERQKAMNTFSSAYRTWNETEVDPWKVTQDYNALAELDLKLARGEPLSELDVWNKMYSQPEKGPLFSRTDALAVIRRLPDKKTPALQSPFADEWVGDTGIIKSLFAEEDDDGNFVIPMDKAGEWATMRQDAEAIIEKHYPDFNKANQELTALVAPVKDANAKSLTRRIWNGFKTAASFVPTTLLPGAPIVIRAKQKAVIRANQKAKLGDEIEKGGRTWKVVAFDNDGEPLVEEVK